MSLLVYLKVIPYIKFEHFAIIRFWVMLRTIRQSDKLAWVIMTRMKKWITTYLKHIKTDYYNAATQVEITGYYTNLHRGRLREDECHCRHSADRDCAASRSVCRYRLQFHQQTFTFSLFYEKIQKTDNENVLKRVRIIQSLFSSVTDDCAVSFCICMIWAG